MMYILYIPDDKVHAVANIKDGSIYYFNRYSPPKEEFYTSSKQVAVMKVKQEWRFHQLIIEHGYKGFKL